MRALGWISVERAAARGRMMQHRINVDVLRSTLRHSDAIGPDFVTRLSEPANPEKEMSGTVVPLRSPTVAQPIEDGSDWAVVL